MASLRQSPAAARFASKSPARRNRVVAALEAADRLDRRAADCCSTSKGKLFSCCSSVSDVTPASLADATFAFVPGWSLQDSSEEVFEHRAVALGPRAPRKQFAPQSALQHRPLKEQPQVTSAFATPYEDLAYEASPRRPMGSRTARTPAPKQLQDTSDVKTEAVAADAAADETAAAEAAAAEEAAAAAAAALPALVPLPAPEPKSSRPPSSSGLPSPQSDATGSASTPRLPLAEATMARPANTARKNAWMPSRVNSWFGLQGGITTSTDADLDASVAETGPAVGSVPACEEAAPTREQEEEEEAAIEGPGLPSQAVSRESSRLSSSTKSVQSAYLGSSKGGRGLPKARQYNYEELTLHLVGLGEDDDGLYRDPRSSSQEPLRKQRQNLGKCPSSPSKLPSVAALQTNTRAQQRHVKLRGQISESCGRIFVRTPGGLHEACLTYRGATARWLVVHSTISEVPLGCTGDYPDSTTAMLALEEIHLEHPTWQPVLKEAEIAEAVAVARVRTGSLAERLTRRHTGASQRQLLLLVGPPGSGKKTAAQGRPEIHAPVRICLSEEDVIKECTEYLFRKLAEGRPKVRTDPIAQEAFLIESLQLYLRFQDVAHDVIWGTSSGSRGGSSNSGAFDLALAAGSGITLKCSSASSTSMLPRAVKQARIRGYRILGIRAQAPSSVLRQRFEARVDKELAAGVMLGARCWGADLDHTAEAVAEAWPTLAGMCDEGRTNDGASQDPVNAFDDMVLHGQSAESCGVLQIKMPQNREVHLTYRHSTAHWLVVHSTADGVPLGCIASYPDSTAMLAGRAELHLRRPAWAPVLSEAQVQEAVVAARSRTHDVVDQLVHGRTPQRQLVIVFGPAGVGRAALAEDVLKMPLDKSVVLSHYQVLRDCMADLFAQLVAGRPRARTDPSQREAFLVEALHLHNSFTETGNLALWKDRHNALDQALQRGLGIIAECSGGASLGGVKPMVTAAREHGYKVIGLFPKLSGSVLRRRSETRINYELGAGKPLGSRRFDAYLDLLASSALRTWPGLQQLCDEVHELDGDKVNSQDLPSTPRSEDLHALVEQHREATEELSEDPQVAAMPDLSAWDADMDDEKPEAPTGKLVSEEKPDEALADDLQPKEVSATHIDPSLLESIVTNLEKAEDRLYSQALALLAQDAAAAAAATPERDAGEVATEAAAAALRNYLLRHSCISEQEVDTELKQLAPDGELNSDMFVKLLRSQAASDAIAQKAFAEIRGGGRSHSALFAVCRSALLKLLKNSEANHPPSSHLLKEDEWNAIVEESLRGCKNTVTQDRFVSCWKRAWRILRALEAALEQRHASV